MAIANANPRHVQLDRSAVRNLDSDVARLERAAVNRLRATSATIERAGIAFAAFDHGTIKQSVVGVAVAKSLACDEVRAGILISPVVRGEVHPWFDMRSAVALGFGMALGQAFLKSTRMLARRR